MKAPTRITTILALLAFAAGTGTVLAQPASATLKDITPCMQIANASEKYACYLRLETEVRAALAGSAAPAQPGSAPAAANPVAVAPATVTLPQAAQATPAVPAPVTTQPEADNSTVAAFGNQTPAAAARVETNGEGEQELHDRIVALQEREPGRFLVTLESGQVWYQSNSQRFRLREGMAVRIYPSPLGGSYRMARDDGEATGFVQVERVR